MRAKNGAELTGFVTSREQIDLQAFICRHLSCETNSILAKISGSIFRRFLMNRSEDSFGGIRQGGLTNEKLTKTSPEIV
jgi:hypothetical protein